MNKQKVKELILPSFLCLSILTIILFSSTTFAGGLSSFGGGMFGGRVTTMVSCVCNTDDGYQASVQGPSSSSGTYLYNNSTKVAGGGKLSMMNHVLGKYSTGGVCLVGEQPYCTELPITKGTMTKIGKSSF